MRKRREKERGRELLGTSVMLGPYGIWMKMRLLLSSVCMGNTHALCTNISTIIRVHFTEDLEIQERNRDLNTVYILKDGYWELFMNRWNILSIISFFKCYFPNRKCQDLNLVAEHKEYIFSVSDFVILPPGILKISGTKK